MDQTGSRQRWIRGGSGWIMSGSGQIRPDQGVSDRIRGGSGRIRVGSDQIRGGSGWIMSGSGRIRPDQGWISPDQRCIRSDRDRSEVYQAGSETDLKDFNLLSLTQSDILRLFEDELIRSKPTIDVIDRLDDQHNTSNHSLTDTVSRAAT
uniref:Uncharacterized protein n=1 Tax=Ditylenchus dipsaci TaxID=166011 RepID=A0A915DFR3_9BILA